MIVEEKSNSSNSQNSQQEEDVNGEWRWRKRRSSRCREKLWYEGDSAAPGQRGEAEMVVCNGYFTLLLVEEKTATQQHRDDEDDRERQNGAADHNREKRRCCWRWRSIKKGQRKMVKPSIDEDGAVAARRDRGWRWRWSTLMMVVKLNSAVGDDADEKGSRDKRRRWDGNGDGED